MTIWMTYWLEAVFWPSSLLPVLDDYQRLLVDKRGLVAPRFDIAIMAVHLGRFTGDEGNAITHGALLTLQPGMKVHLTYGQYQFRREKEVLVDRIMTAYRRYLSIPA